MLEEIDKDGNLLMMLRIFILLRKMFDCKKKDFFDQVTNKQTHFNAMSRKRAPVHLPQ